jgi:hypothetical protein
VTTWRFYSVHMWDYPANWTATWGEDTNYLHPVHHYQPFEDSHPWREHPADRPSWTRIVRRPR